MHACMHTYTHTYIHTCIYIYVYVYLYIGSWNFRQGSSVGELKTAMARDNASNAGPHDFELGIAGGSGRPLANEVVGDAQ